MYLEHKDLCEMPDCEVFREGKVIWKISHGQSNQAVLKFTLRSLLSRHIKKFTVIISHITHSNT